MQLVPLTFVAALVTGHDAQVLAVAVVSPIKHANEVISLISRNTDRAILFYSGGKDSLVLLDLMAPHFKEVVCVFMYFVKDLKHIQPYLDHVNTYPNCRLIQVPHFMLTSIFNVGRYCAPNPTIKVRTLKHVDAAVRKMTGINWTFYGWKQADNMTRRIVLRQYTNEAISESTQKAYPLSLWKKADVLAYVKAKRLPMPVDYKSSKASVGMQFDPEVFNWLRTYYPSDLELIYQTFPMSKQILFEYDNEQKNKVPVIRGDGHTPEPDKECAVQPATDQRQGKGRTKKEPEKARPDDDACMEQTDRKPSKRASKVSAD